MSENLNAPVGSQNWYEMENQRLRQQLTAVTEQLDNLNEDYGKLLAESNRYEEQRDRAQKAVIDADQYIGNCFRREWQKAHEKAIAEAGENGDGF